MDYKKQLADIDKLIDQTKKNVDSYDESYQHDDTHEADDMLNYYLGQIGLLLSAAFEAHKLPDMARRVLEDLEKQDVIDRDFNYEYFWSPRLARAKLYFEVLKAIAIPTKLDTIERHAKAVGTVFATVLALSAIITGAYQAGKAFTKTDTETKVIHVTGDHVTTSTITK